MDDLEQIMRDGLQTAVQQRPPIEPLDLGRAEPAPALARSRLVAVAGLAASLVVAAGLTVWALTPRSAPVTAEPGNSTSTKQLRLLKVVNKSHVAYVVRVTVPGKGALTVGPLGAGETTQVDLDAAVHQAPAPTPTDPPVGGVSVDLTGCVPPSTGAGAGQPVLVVTLTPDADHPGRVVARLQAVSASGATVCRVAVQEGSGVYSATPAISVPPTSPAPVDPSKSAPAEPLPTTSPK